jgi:hypothetical protein
MLFSSILSPLSSPLLSPLLSPLPCPFRRYNDPTVTFEIYSQSPIWDAFSILFGVTFITAMLSFWLCLIDVVRLSPVMEFAENTRGMAFYLPKAILMTSLWFTVVAVYMWTRLQQDGDPVHNQPTDLKHFVFLKMLSFLVLAIYGIWLIYLILRSVAVLRRLRLSFVFFFLLTAFVIVVTFLGVATGAYNPLPARKTNFLPFLTLSNLYVMTLAWAYQPGDMMGGMLGGLGGDQAGERSMGEEGELRRSEMIALGQDEDAEDDLAEADLEADRHSRDDPGGDDDEEESARA